MNATQNSLILPNRSPNQAIAVPNRSIVNPGRSAATMNMSRRSIRQGSLLAYDNSLSAFDVQLWAQEGLAILLENMVMGMLVHRDFDNVIAKYGDTVNVRKPNQFKGIRKTNADAVTVQNASAINIPVKLNQLIHVSYLIKDGEESVAFTSIIDEFLRPAMQAEARFIDMVLSTQVYQFLPNAAGQLLGLNTTNAKQYILQTRNVMNINKAWMNDRNLVLGPMAESTMLDVEQFTDAYRVGDDGSALRNASLGRKLGFDILMAQNMPYVSPQVTGVVTGAINHTAGYNPGATSFTVSGFSAAIAAGSWITIAGDATPLRVISTTGGATPTGIVTAQGIQNAIATAAVVSIYPVGATTAAYLYDPVTQIGYAKEIAVTGLAVAPQIGQMVTFGSDPTIYGIIDVNGTIGITLDRPIEVNIGSGATVNLGPSGGFNFAFHPNALTLVTRPMAVPRTGTGALSAVVEYMGLSIRVVITYDGNMQGHLVTLDILAGVKPLDYALGAVLMS